MIDVYDTKNIEVKFLQSLKKNHNLTSRQIAQKLEMTEAAISNWLSGKSTPTKANKHKIMALLKKEWQPGLVRFPATKGVWSGPYYLRVRDILAPYDTWVDLEWSGNEPELHASMIKRWEAGCGNNYRIMKVYPNYDTFCKEARNDETIYNCTQELYGNRPEAAHAYNRPWEIAWDIITELEKEKQELENA